MRFTEALGGTLLCLFINLKVRTSKSGLIQAALQCRAFEYPGRDPVLQLKDCDDLIHRPGRDLPPKLDRLLQKIIIVFREFFTVPGHPVFWL